MRFLVFAGTTEGRQVLEQLAGRGAFITVCVATAYGGAVLPNLPDCTIHTGRLDEEGIEQLLQASSYDCVFDATHPYAAAATGNIRAACITAGVEYVRVLREESEPGGCVYLPDTAAAADYLCGVPGNVLLTTGSKELDCFTRIPDYQERLYPRVLPVPESLERCRALGFSAGHILCMQGPFSEEFNLATLRQLDARYLVTKESGAAGGFPEKRAAAQKAGATLVVIGRPETQPGLTLNELPAFLTHRFGFAPRVAANMPFYVEPTKQEALQMPAIGQETGASTPTQEQNPGFFPLFVNLQGKTVVVVGAGTIAARRAETLSRFGCTVKMIAPNANPQAQALAASGRVDWQRRAYAPGDCSGAALAVAATDDPAVNRAVGAECRAAGIPVSVADCQAACTFYFPGIAKQGAAVAGMTAGGNHRLARRITERIRADAVHWEEKQDV